MGVVVEAFDPTLERAVAIKILAADAVAADPTSRERLLREARAAATLSHPNVVNVIAVGETASLGVPYILMERVPGRSLERQEGTAPADISLVTRVLGDVAEALAAAHGQGLIHRDLKPSNVVIDERSGRAVVLDFGISTRLPSPERREAKLTGTGMFLGTPTYMSPEQALSEPVTEKSDIYSLGCLLYELLAGRPVFEATSPMAVMASHIKDTPVPLHAVRPDLPEPLADAVMAMLAKRPEERPAADDLRRRFAPAPEHHPWREGAVEEMRRWARAVVLTGSALATLAVLEYAILIGVLPAAPALVQAGLIGSFAVALLLYVGATVGAFLALRRDQVPASLVQLIAGDWAEDAGMLLDRLRHYAEVAPDDRLRLVRALRWRGVASLSAAPATLGLLALVVLVPGMGSVPRAAQWALLLLPSFTVLLSSLVVERRRGPRGRGPRFPRGGAGGVAALRTFHDWAARHSSTLEAQGTARGSALRVLFASLNMGLAAAGVAMLVGVQVFAARSRSERRIPNFEAARIHHDQVAPLYALATAPLRPLAPESTLAAWDALMVAPMFRSEADPARVEAGKAGDRLRAAKEMMGVRRRGRDETAALLLEAAFRGLTGDQRRGLEDALGGVGIGPLRAAARSSEAMAWSALMSRREVQGRPVFALVVPSQYALEAVERHIIAATLAVDAGRVDSAEALLWEVVRSAGLLDAAARGLNDQYAAGVYARMALSGLRVIYVRRRQVERLLAILRPSTPPQLTPGDTLRATGDPLLDLVRAGDTPPGIRWEALHSMRLRGCGDPRVLLGTEDPAYAEASQVLRRSAAPGTGDATLLGLIDSSLVHAAALDDAEPRFDRRWYLPLADLAALAGRRELAGCLKMYALGI